jgi:hypothetical protein
MTDSIRDKTEYHRRHKTRRNRKKSEEVINKAFILCGVVTVTFKVLSLFLVTQCYNHSKTALKLIVPPDEYPINKIV